MVLGFDSIQIILDELFIRTERLKPHETILAKSWINKLLANAVNNIPIIPNPINNFLTF